MTAERNFLITLWQTEKTLRITVHSILCYILASAHGFNMDKFKILSFGKELTLTTELNKSNWNENVDSVD